MGLLIVLYIYYNYNLNPANINVLDWTMKISRH